MTLPLREHITEAQAIFPRSRPWQGACSRAVCGTSLLTVLLFGFLAPVLTGPRAHCHQLHSFQPQWEPAGHRGSGWCHPALWYVCSAVAVLVPSLARAQAFPVHSLLLGCGRGQSSAVLWPWADPPESLSPVWNVRGHRKTVPSF